MQNILINGQFSNFLFVSYTKYFVYVTSNIFLEVPRSNEHICCILLFSEQFFAVLIENFFFSSIKIWNNNAYCSFVVNLLFRHIGNAIRIFFSVKKIITVQSDVKSYIAIKYKTNVDVFS